jgi:hypothetical protein
VLVVIAFLLGCLLTALILRRPVDRAAKAAKAPARAAERSASDAASTAADLRPGDVPRTRPKPARTPRFTRSAVVGAVPQDAVPPLPKLSRRGPFTYSGVQDGAKETEEVFAIGWPEPGTAAVAEVAVRATRQAFLSISPLTRTANRVRTHDRLTGGWAVVHKSLGLVTRDVTHLRVNGRGGRREWAVRLLSPAEIESLPPTRSGRGSTVFAVRDETPVELVAEVASNDWSVTFACGCWSVGPCDCPVPAVWSGYPNRTIASTGTSTERTTNVLAVPRPGLIVVRVAAETDPWQLRLRAAGSEPADNC